ncbi:MAG: hypothetical protein Q9227_007861 [Pyrenula ochraceoflavens]
MQVGDIPRAFNFPDNHFDLVHSRMLVGGISASRWPTYIRAIARSLKHDGGIQMFEFDFNVQSDNGTLDRHSGLVKWCSLYRNALRSSENPNGRKDPDIAGSNGRMRNYLVAAGFTSIRERSIRVPLSGWRTDSRWNRIGRHMKGNMAALMESAGLYPILQRRINGREIDATTFASVLEQARGELRNEFKPYMTLQWFKMESEYHKISEVVALEDISMKGFGSTGKEEVKDAGDRGRMVGGKGLMNE